MIPWDLIFASIAPQLGATIVLAVIVIIAWQRKWFVTGTEFEGVRLRLIKERDAERVRAEQAEAKVIALLEEQINAYRDEKRTAEIVAEAKRAEQRRWEAEHGRPPQQYPQERQNEPREAPDA